jgi:hypothetical protein
MDPIKTRPGKGPEAIIQAKICNKLRQMGWLVMETHGNAFQMGFPDIYATHVDVGGRWIEVKNPLKYAFTPAQLKFFPLLSANGTPIWILTSDSDGEIKKLFRPQNWHHYLKGAFDVR